MSTAIVFNKEMQNYFNSNNSLVAEFLRTKFKESHRQNYNGFFDDFLFTYGIISFNSVPILNGKQYIPSLTCSKNNIFREEKGLTELSKEPKTLLECEKIFAQYFISRFNDINLSYFTNWDSEKNYN
jgi:hypothetical protein